MAGTRRRASDNFKADQTAHRVPFIKETSCGRGARADEAVVRRVWCAEGGMGGPAPPPGPAALLKGSFHPSHGCHLPGNSGSKQIMLCMTLSMDVHVQEPVWSGHLSKITFPVLLGLKWGSKQASVLAPALPLSCRGRSKMRKSP